MTSVGGFKVEAQNLLYDAA